MKDSKQGGTSKRHTVVILSIFLVVFVVAIGIALGTQRSMNSLIGQTAPQFTLQNLDGEIVTSSVFKGKVVVLDFWATWCPPCRMEIPDFIELQKEYGGKGFTFVGVSLDQDGPEVVKKFVKASGMNYPQLMGSVEVVSSYGNFEGIPTAFVIDKNGIIRNIFVGYRPKDVFEKEIKKLLNIK